VPAEVLKGETPEMKAVRDECYAIVKNLRQDEQAGVVYQSTVDEKGHPLFDLSLLTNAGRKQFDHVGILNYFEGNIVASMLYDLLMGGQPNTLQYRGASPPDFFADSIHGWLDVIVDVFNAHAIPRLYRVNGWSTEACAKLRHGEVRAPDIQKLADFISKIAPAGFLTPGTVTERHLRRAAGLPDETDPTPLLEEPEGDEEDPAPDDTDAEPEQPQEPTKVRKRRSTPTANNVPAQLRTRTKPLRIAEMASLLGYTPRGVQKLMDAGALRFIQAKKGGERRVPAAEARRLMREQGMLEERD